LLWFKVMILLLIEVWQYPLIIAFVIESGVSTFAYEFICKGTSVDSSL
jgi:hypothetical protein